MLSRKNYDNPFRRNTQKNTESRFPHTCSRCKINTPNGASAAQRQVFGFWIERIINYCSGFALCVSFPIYSPCVDVWIAACASTLCASNAKAAGCCCTQGSFHIYSFHYILNVQCNFSHQTHTGGVHDGAPPTNATPQEAAAKNEHQTRKCA